MRRFPSAVVDFTFRNEVVFACSRRFVVVVEIELKKKKKKVPIEGHNA